EPPNNLRHSARAGIVERWIFRLPDGNVNLGRAPKLKGRWDHADDCVMPPVQRQSFTYGTRRRTKSIPPESLVHTTASRRPEAVIFWAEIPSENRPYAK